MQIRIQIINLFLKRFYSHLALIAFFIYTSSLVLASKLENYQVKKCNQNHICVVAQSNEGFISMNGEHLSSVLGTLEITDLKTKKKEKFNCQSLSYNFKSESLICDNSDSHSSNTPSLLIDAQLNITRINSNLIAANSAPHLKKPNK